MLGAMEVEDLYDIVLMLLSLPNTNKDCECEGLTTHY